jgi:hypothetical protein
VENRLSARRACRNRAARFRRIGKGRHPITGAFSGRAVHRGRRDRIHSGMEIRK